MDVLAARESALVAVSLAAAAANTSARRRAHDVVRALLDHTGWTPQAVVHAADVLPYTHYPAVVRPLLRHIAARRGYPTDTSRDHELTDWQRLEENANGLFPLQRIDNIIGFPRRDCCVTRP